MEFHVLDSQSLLTEVLFDPVHVQRSAKKYANFAKQDQRGVTVPHFTQPTPVPVGNELLFGSNCTILKTCKMIWSAVLFVLHYKGKSN